VSYNHKHNAVNGEGNRDGTDDNRSWNCGVEGPSDDPAVESLRTRQVKNFLTLTMLSLGVPMMLMGDEVRRTQRGNNNNYCHDDESNWFDWSLLDKHSDIHRFVQQLCSRRVLCDVEHERNHVSIRQMLVQSQKAWHGVKLLAPDWSDDSHGVALSAVLAKERIQFHLILNSYWAALEFELPNPGIGNPWRRWIDTALASPDDIVPWEIAPAVPCAHYRAEARSVVMLIAEMPGS
jgi:glycogen operon protein